MKTLYKNIFYAASAVLMCLFFASSASAQRTVGGGGGGGGSRPSSTPSSSPSVSSARPSVSSGGGSYSRPSSVGVSRPSGGSSVSHPGAGVGMRSGVSGVQRNPNYVNRQGMAPRGGYNYVNRQGMTPRVGFNDANRQGVVARGSYGIPPRVGITPVRGSSAVSGYRSAPRVGYGHGTYWSAHNYYHYNRGYYTTYYGPRLGYRCRYLPYGYYPFFWSDYQYFLCDGLFYTYDNSEYTVVDPPIGAEITTLPEKAQSIVINGQQYYECNGVYYQPFTKDDGTVVYMVAGKDGELNTGSTVQDDQPAGPQLGDIVTQLPPDCRKIKVNGEKLYISPDGVYYQELVDANGNKTYKIVGLPADDDDQN